MTNDELMNMAVSMSGVGSNDAPVEEVSEQPQEVEVPTHEAIETPTEEVAEQQTEPQEEVIEQQKGSEQPQAMPQVDHDALAEMVAQKVKDGMRQDEVSEPTEDEVALQEMMKRLGIDKLQATIQQQQQIIDQFKQQEEARQQQEMMMQQHQQTESAINMLKSEDVNFDPQKVHDEIIRMYHSGEINEATASNMLSTPVHWRLVHNSLVAKSKPIAKPDPITPVQSPTSVKDNNVMDRLKSGQEVDRIDLGNMLLAASGR